MLTLKRATENKNWSLLWYAEKDWAVMTLASHFDVNIQHCHAKQCWILTSDHQSQLNRGEYKHGALNEGHSLNAASWALSPQKTYAPMTSCQGLIREFFLWSFISKQSDLVYIHTTETTSQLAVADLLTMYYRQFVVHLQGPGHIRSDPSKLVSECM